MTEKESEIPDFKIAYDGTWFHNGAIIKRDALAKLFSDRALKIDDEGRYWLQTPFEKYEVMVEDVPYIVVDYDEGDGDLKFTTNMGESMVLSKDHPLELRIDKKSGDTLPYILVRNGLYARLGRSVYYNLVERYGAEIKMNGQSYPLGEL